MLLVHFVTVSVPNLRPDDAPRTQKKNLRMSSAHAHRPSTAFALCQFDNPLDGPTDSAQVSLSSVGRKLLEHTPYRVSCVEVNLALFVLSLKCLLGIRSIANVVMHITEASMLLSHVRRFHHGWRIFHRPIKQISSAVFHGTKIAIFLMRTPSANHYKCEFRVRIP